jgi:hypothetical protein
MRLTQSRLAVLFLKLPLGYELLAASPKSPRSWPNWWRDAIGDVTQKACHHRGCQTCSPCRMRLLCS